jgi:hypothetical protein
MDMEGKPDGKGSLGRYRGRWENNNKMDLQVIGWMRLQWIDLACGRNQWLAFVKAIRNLIKQTNKQIYGSIIIAL